MWDRTLADGMELLAGIEACMAQSGREGFAAPFLELVQQTGAAQVMIFAYRSDHAACFMSRNFRAGALGSLLAAEYLEGWYRQDPLYGQVMAMAPGELQSVDFARLKKHMSADYRQRFFAQPGLSGKTAVLAAGARLRISLNLYWDGPDEYAGGPLSAILARLALQHFETERERSYPAPLEVLSHRERSVCLGILAGKKAEQIATDLEIAPSSVVTYRRRAYDKLGISSRGSLFALCRD